MYNQGETYTTKSVEGDKIVTTTYTKASETTGDIYEPLLEVCKSKQLACEMSQEKGDTISRYEGVNCNKVFEDCIAG